MYKQIVVIPEKIVKIWVSFWINLGGEGRAIVLAAIITPLIGAFIASKSGDNTNVDIQEYSSTVVSESSDPYNTPINDKLEMDVEIVSDIDESIRIERGHDSISICTSEKINKNLIKIQLIGQNTEYTLSEIFLYKNMSECWCIKQYPTNFPSPETCNTNNTIERSKVSDWRNAKIEVLYSDRYIGQCLSQSASLSIYSCIFYING